MGTGMVFRASVLLMLLALLAGPALAGDGASGDKKSAGKDNANHKQNEEANDEKSDASDEPTKPLQFDLPEARTVSTPSDMPAGLRLDPKRVERIEDATAQREPMTVPEATTLLSRGKPVSMSADWAIMGEPALITDGDKSAGAGSYLELAPGKKWVQIDLQKPAVIEAINLWHFHGQPRVYYDVVVQVSADKDFKNNVTTVFNNDADNSLGLGAGEDFEYVENYEGRLIYVAGVTGRYVRLYVNGNTSNQQNHFTEVSVFGQWKGEKQDKDKDKSD